MSANNLTENLSAVTDQNQPVYFSSQMKIFQTLECVFQYACDFFLCQLNIPEDKISVIRISFSKAKLKTQQDKHSRKCRAARMQGI